jgi:hypothetical protein
MKNKLLTALVLLVLAIITSGIYYLSFSTHFYNTALGLQ